MLRGWVVESSWRCSLHVWQCDVLSGPAVMLQNRPSTFTKGACLFCFSLSTLWLKDNSTLSVVQHKWHKFKECGSGCLLIYHSGGWSKRLIGSWPIWVTWLGPCLKKQRNKRMNSFLTAWPVIVVTVTTQVLSLTPCSSVLRLVPAYRVRNWGWEVEWFAQGHEANRSQLQVTYPSCCCTRSVWVYKASESMKENICKCWGGVGVAFVLVQQSFSKERTTLSLWTVKSSIDSES